MGEVLPLALGIAASPFPVIPAILLLFTDRARAAAWAFLVGWLLGIAVSTGVFVLLAEVVDANAASSEFFLRKAIGWALRDLAHRDPGWVRGFLAEHGAALSPLSVREASKHL